MLRGLGSTETIPQSRTRICCDICSSDCTRPELDFLIPPKRDRCPRRRVIRTVSRPLGEILKKRLLDERDSIVDSDIGYKMLGKELLIPSKCIEELCRQVRFVKSVDDVSVSGLRAEFVPRLYSVMMVVLNEL